ncbi:unnamed protein product [Schistocephalus solidus]|uniref:Protein TSSC4 n=1 Tax=Schistocephalus solidus TaxID=70667 RepID=A0A183TPL2_SCHSO|nr:unnamed protein product [Schistocephalus solidus]
MHLSTLAFESKSRGSGLLYRSVSEYTPTCNLGAPVSFTGSGFLCKPTVFVIISSAAYLGLHPVASKKVNTHVIFLLTEILASNIRKRNTARLSAVPGNATDSSKTGFNFENLKLTNLDENIEGFSISPAKNEHKERYVTASRSRPLSRGRQFIPQLQAIQELSEEEAKSQEQTDVAEEAYGIHVDDKVYNNVEKVKAPEDKGN